jgi:hypothetical protein
LCWLLLLCKGKPNKNLHLLNKKITIRDCNQEKSCLCPKGKGVHLFVEKKLSKTCPKPTFGLDEKAHIFCFSNKISIFFIRVTFIIINLTSQLQISKQLCCSRLRPNKNPCLTRYLWGISWKKVWAGHLTTFFNWRPVLLKNFDQKGKGF